MSVAIFVAGPVTGAGVNPARALGPMIVAARFTDWWAYILGPILGGVAASVLYDRLLRPGALLPAPNDGRADGEGSGA